MAAIPKVSRRGRWLVPMGVVAVVAGVGIASAITVAQAAPALPPRTPAQLLAAVAGDHSAPPPLTGTVVETATLGIPELPGDNSPSSDDNRFWTGPDGGPLPVPRANFLGKPFLVHVPSRVTRWRGFGREWEHQGIDWERVRWLR